MATATGRQKPNVIQRSQTGTIPETVPELTWPGNIAVYDKMRRDGKCGSVLSAMTMPIRATAWHVIDSPDVRPEVAQFVRTNLGLVEEGDSRQRRRGQGISWDSVLRHALLMLPFGHMFFEPVYQLAPAGPNDSGLPGGRQYAYLSRLAPILPTSIAEFDVDPAGDLDAIKQWQTDPTGRTLTRILPRDLIVPVIYDREGADWTGTSILRSAYKHWWFKEQLEKLAFSITERNGMGIPTADVGQDSDRPETLAALSSVRAGDLAGIAFPPGANFRLVGVDGTLVDPMPQIDYHGQEIGKSMLAMFLDLGHDAGARSLGETFVDFFTLAVNAVIADLEETFTEDVSRRLVALNFGDQEAYPEIAADEITPQAPVTAESIGALITAGALTADDSLQAFVRHMYGMPPATPTDADQDPVPVEPVEDVLPVQAGGGGSHMSGETLAERETRLTRMRRALGRRRG